MKCTFLLCLFLPGLLLFTSCERCDQHRVADLKFTPDELKINPYSGKEILVFRDLQGDSLVFPPGTRTTTNQRIYKYDYETAKLDHNGCQGDYYDTQTDWTDKYDSASPALRIALGFRFRLDNPTNARSFQLRFWAHIPALNGFHGDYDFKADTLENCVDYYYYPAPGYRDSIAALHPLLVIGPKSFSNVYELYGHNPDHRDSAWISTAWYSVAEGLVGFRTSYGRTWYLDKIR